MFKKTKFLFPLITIGSVAGLTSIVASCDDTNNYKTFDFKFDGDLVLKADRNSLQFNILPADKLSDFLNSKFNKAINDLKSEIAEYFTSQYEPEIKYSGTNEFLIPSASKFSDYPKSIKVNVQTKSSKFTFDFKFESIDQNLELGKLGEKGQSAEQQKAAAKIASIKVSNNFGYIAYYQGLNRDNKKVELPVNLFSSAINKVVDSSINPTLSNYQVVVDPSIYKTLNIDWEAPINKNLSFKAKVLSASDGDTFTIEAKESKIIAGQQITKGETYKIRLAGIDTPEKAVGSGKNVVAAAPFEYSFALLASKFGEKVLTNKEVIVGFVEGKDAYERITADIFFGDNFQHSYNTEIVRAGYTLPLAKQTYNPEGTQQVGSYEAVIYPEIAKAMAEAKQNKRGFFHYFENSSQVARFIYLIKPNTSYIPFEKLVENK
ncbi:thermonuclease family protein [Mycoplasma nasistruthionis]|uniref:TNase-like domain-containing protein n=1 Tax=Mycoplasma nasistruthionis TaxID=353852 RepID=A0A5B7XUC9_9MOLU|nr:thermonuclease family protein [Mycoplasma nasistruthionis]QCZ36479.1 hypothetical protein FG904_00350 [Mycoplasma nasistruthionis]